MLGPGASGDRQETCWDGGPGTTALSSVTIATTVVTMETLWRTALVCTVVMVASEVAGSHRNEFVKSQGEMRKSQTSNWTRYVFVVVNILEKTHR